MAMMPSPDSSGLVRAELDHAQQCVELARQGLAAQPTAAVTLHAAVDGVHRVAGALAREVVADLHALHGCLTAGTLLLEPALEDLRGLTGAAGSARGRAAETADPPSEASRSAGPSAADPR
ncbi:hypothetical protein ACFS2C_28155 [Prauserella oleivorans]|uniref:Uncharacterized protein n=1 Tax=Prauserella oleivorans TaxID=1478153 RepID=A0ABW5WJM2_9PSEU